MSAAPFPRRPDDRYGRPPSRRSRLLVGVIAGVVLLAGVIFVGVRFADQPVRADTISYRHLDDAHISLTFQVTARPGTEVSCSVQALDRTRGQVGFTQVRLPAQSAEQTVHSVDIATQGTAVSAQVTGCDRA